MKWFHFRHEHGIVSRESIGEVVVSTVFLGLNHRWGEGSPILWETMVFGGKLDMEQDRCSGSLEQAQAMHRDMVVAVKKAETEP
jgi:hypothetical protein